MRRTTATISICLSVFLFLQPSLTALAENEGSGSLSVQPTQISVSTVPGGNISGEIILGNNNEKPIKVECQTLDVISSLTGNTYGLLDEKDPYSVARWIKLDKTSFAILPGEPLKVSYKTSVPYGVKIGSYWGIVFFNLQKEKKTNEGKYITVSERIGIKVLVDVLELKKAETLDFKVKKSFINPKNIKFYVRLKNLGSVPIQPPGRIDIEGISGGANGRKEEAALNFPRLDPGEEKEIEINAKLSSSFGKYRASLNFSEKEIENKNPEITFSVVPYNIILAALLFGACLLAVAKKYGFFGKTINRFKSKKPKRKRAKK